jgi:hypothetical protein
VTSKASFRIALGAVLVVCLALVPAALAGKGGGGNGHGGTTGASYSLNLAMVNDANGNGLPNWADTITFSVSTTATTQPHVSLQCSQSGTVVYTTQTGYYDGYAWPWTQNMTLWSGAWTAGAADCTATLYDFSASKTVTLGTLSFHVDA